MSLSDHLEIVHSLAEQGVLDDPDPGMAAQVAAQRTAVDTFGDFVGNHWETLDERYLPEATAPEIDLDALRAVPQGELGQALVTCLELACQQIPEDFELGEEADRLGASIDQVAAFWTKHGPAIERDLLILPIDWGQDASEDSPTL